MSDTAAEVVTNDAAAEVVAEPIPPAPIPKLDYRRLDNPETEQEQLEAYAQASIGAMEIAAVFVQAVESWGYSKPVLDQFEKYIRRALNTLESEVPNQYKRRVLNLVQHAMKEADDAGQYGDNGLPAEGETDIITALMGIKAKEQMEAGLVQEMIDQANGKST